MRLKKIRPGMAVRCMAWFECTRKNCRHYHFHTAGLECIVPDKVQYCGVIEGFVSDLPADLIDKDAAKDPNLAFRMRKDVLNKGDSN